MSLRLEWENEQSIIDITPALAGLLEELLRIAGGQTDIGDGEVSLTFVTDEAIRELNRDYRGIDRATDVLSFAMQEETDEELDIIYGEDGDADADDTDDPEDSDEAMEADDPDDDSEADFDDMLGDIVISVERAREQSEEYGHSLEREIGFLFVHGFLHLIGYDHQNEAEEKAMFALQEQILQEAGLVR